MEFKPFSPKQLSVLCWWCEHSPFRNRDAIICDGAVRSGKTLCMFISFVFWAFYRFQGQSFALCGKTATSLRRNILTPMLPILTDLGFDCKLIQSRGELIITFGHRTNTFFLFGGKDESSAALIQGLTLAGVMFDEVALMPRSFVEQALARCSVSGSKFWFNCNPSYPSHWFYLEWIKKQKEKNALYLHFLMDENPSLDADILDRYRSLYSGAFYERYILGKWVAAEGLIYPMFKEEDITTAPGECSAYFVSCDYGTVNPSSFGLWGLVDGVWYRLEEYYYDSRRQGQQKTDEEYYVELERLICGRNIKAVICDPSAASFITCIKRHGHYRVIPARNDVLDGIRKVSDALKSGRIRICKGCADTIREFSLYRWDESGSKDAPIKENDHAMDDIRYFVSTVLSGPSATGGVAIAAHRN